MQPVAIFFNLISQNFISLSLFFIVRSAVSYYDGLNIFCLIFFIFISLS